jgi:NAD(P)-dependent dehydrogenase (short-subunit alcohol dehydrogenase family)
MNVSHGFQMRKTNNAEVKTVFITGASSGIGRATAEYFATQGWDVVASMRNPQKAGSLSELDGVHIVACDVTDPESIQSAVLQAHERFGQIDVLVNNAGYGLVGPFEAVSEEQIRQQFEVNVFGLQAVTRAVLPQMRERGSGTIVNISSIGGRMTFPLYSSYHATKWAVDGFSESLSYELELLGIRVRIVEPGPVKTDFYDRSMDLNLETAPEEYRPLLERIMPRLAGEVRGAGPEEIARDIYHAATAGRRLRYPSGRTGKMILFLRRLLPESWFFVIIRFVFTR